VQLRLTRRALEDLGLPVAVHAHQPATDYSDAHDVVRVFVERRSQDPKGQEWTDLPSTAAPVYNVHHGRYRGLTWHDEDSDVVWLLGVGWHESGSADDAYEVLKSRDAAGTLMPDEDDYLDLELSLEEARSFVNQVAEQAPALIGRARAAIGQEQQSVIAGRLTVNVFVETAINEGEDESLEEVWVSFEMPPLPGDCALPQHPEWILVVVAAMVPEATRLDDLSFDESFPRPGGTRSNEIVLCWRSF